ncbi:MAG TPA: gluconate 2-dehydrogenase subunit 3 family protein [Lacunisphaera sp.]|nr:gluconate 2-dehydrogenase subunit 3 family protein [Lacunisphaera sp.]
MKQPPSSPGRPVSRRTVLKVGLVGLAGAAVGGGSTALLGRLGRIAPPPWRFFTAAEAGLLIDICEQLIPGDDTPGATETGTIHYIDRQLCGVFARHQATYRRGLETFHQTCLREHGQPFQALPADKKIAVLKAIESGQAPQDLWVEPTPQAFFNLVLAHTMQGFYGSPRHGGNRDYASYRMLGLDYPPIVGRNREG